MKYNPDKHHRRSIRLKGYDYSQEGAYFITLCINKRLCLFGDVVDDEVQLNDAGKMLQTWWDKLSGKYENIKLDEYIIMPNHMHGIIFIVGADPCVCPKGQTVQTQPEGEHAGSPLQNNVIPLSRMIQWFKMMSTNEYIINVKQKNWLPFYKKLWQRDYYERIIRNENELNKIRDYIIYNPHKWDLDRNNPKNWEQINDRQNNIPL
jgi:putative transposase